MPSSASSPSVRPLISSLGAAAALLLATFPLPQLVSLLEVHIRDERVPGDRVLSLGLFTTCLADDGLCTFSAPMSPQAASPAALVPNLAALVPLPALFTCLLVLALVASVTQHLINASILWGDLSMSGGEGLDRERVAGAAGGIAHNGARSRSRTRALSRHVGLLGGGVGCLGAMALLLAPCLSRTFDVNQRVIPSYGAFLILVAGAFLVSGGTADRPTASISLDNSPFIPASPIYFDEPEKMRHFTPVTPRSPLSKSPVASDKVWLVLEAIEEDDEDVPPSPIRSVFSPTRASSVELVGVFVEEQEI